MKQRNELQQRASDFLARPIPTELKPDYVPGSLAEIVLTKYAKYKPIDAELQEIAAMAVEEYANAIASAQTDELKNYYQECRTIVQAIIAAQS